MADEVDVIRNQSQLRYQRPFDRGILTQPAVQSEIWHRLLAGILQIDPRDHELCVTEAVMTPEPLMEELDEIVFEDFGFNKCIRKPAAAFEMINWNAQRSGLDNCLQGVNDAFGVVVDSGFSFSHVIPFAHGKAIRHAVRILTWNEVSVFAALLAWAALICLCFLVVGGKQIKRVNVGGKLLTNWLKEIVSYRQWNMMDEFKLMDDVKKALCYVSLDFDQELYNTQAEIRRIKFEFSGNRNKEASSFAHSLLRQQTGPSIKRHYVLPDFQTVMHGYVKEDAPESEGNGDGQAGIEEQVLSMESERFTVPEVLFNPSDVGVQQAGIAEACAMAINSLEPDLQCLVARNIILTGGNTLFPNFQTRFQREVRMLLPDTIEDAVYLPDDPILYGWQSARRFVYDVHSSGLVDRFAVSREQYLEQGHRVCLEKFSDW